MLASVRGKGTLPSLLGAFALLAASCGGESEPEGPPIIEAPQPQTYQILVDAPSPAGENLSFLTFFPASITAHPGDTIAAAHRGDLVPHTITFGVAPDRSNEPITFSDGEGNPALEQGCFESGGPTSDLVACEVQGSWSSLPPYAGVGYWNSGFILETAQAQVPLDPAIPPGDYPFLCLLHPAMTGLLQVVSGQDPADDPAAVRAEADALVASTRPRPARAR